MQITMPNIPDTVMLEDVNCKLLIVRFDETGDHVTAIIGDTEVIYFDPADISYSGIEYFHDHYTIVREYAPGEKLIVTQ